MNDNDLSADLLRYVAMQQTRSAMDVMDEHIDQQNRELVEDLSREVLIQTANESFDKRPIYGLIIMMCERYDMGGRTVQQHVENILGIYRKMAEAMDQHKDNAVVQGHILEMMLVDFDETYPIRDQEGTTDGKVHYLR